MPYINIKAWPKDSETKEKLVNKINEAFLEIWGCPQEAITIAIEEVAPEKWEDTVVNPEILPNAHKLMILDGKKKY